jgi:hypothetical protein
MSTLPPQPKRLRVEFTVPDEAAAAELEAAWMEIVAGKRERTETAAQELDKIMDRAMVALPRILDSVRENYGTKQSGRLVRFLAALYDRYSYDFDLSQLRQLDSPIAQACIDYLNYDRTGKADLYHHLPNEGKEVGDLISDHLVLPRLDLRDAQPARLLALEKRSQRPIAELVRDSVEELLRQEEGRLFMSLRPIRARPRDEEAPQWIVHAHRRGNLEVPLCGGTAEPSKSCPFNFADLTCARCQDAVLALREP